MIQHAISVKRLAWFVAAAALVVAMCGRYSATAAEPDESKKSLGDVLKPLIEAHPEIRSIDLNPLIISDGRPVAVDALVEVEDPR